MSDFESWAESNGYDVRKVGPNLLDLYRDDNTMFAWLCWRSAQEQLRSRNTELELILRRIVDDLPSSRDWLDPVLEKQARAMLAAAKGEGK